MKWTSDTPAEPGTYWLYGYTSKFDRTHNQPRMHLVTVNQNRSKHLFFVTDGHFIYRKDFEGLCLWSPATLPIAPKRQLGNLIQVPL